MKTMKMLKKTLIYMGIILLLISSLGAYLLTPLFRISSQKWLQKSSSEEIRENAHNVLKYFPSHEAYVCLMNHGNEDSIPFLLEGIKKVNNEDFVECAYSHCREALIRITGQDHGYDYDKWINNIKR